MKFQAEHGSKLKELHRTQVLSQQIRGIIITIDEVDFCQAAVNDLANVVVPDIDVLQSLFSDRIRGDKNRALVISADRNGGQVVAELPQKGMHPDYLAATIGERHVLSLSTGQRNSLLRSGGPGDESFCHLDKVTGLGSTVKGVGRPVRVGAS